MKTLAIIADDHTGAADSGIHFARVGGKISLLLDTAGLDQKLRELDAVALSTESRFLDGGAAASVVRGTIELCRKAGISRFFKKVDSTMRGNPGSEIAAVLEATGSRAALVCTAMPNAGRTCMDGVILLDNTPLHTTHFGKDPFHPLSTSVVSELLARQCDLPFGSLSLADVRGQGNGLAARVRDLLDNGCRLIIADALENEDLQALGELLADTPQLLPVGAAGLASAVAKALSHANMVQDACQVLSGRILAIVGSLAGISRAQADMACAEGRFTPLDLAPEAAASNLDTECRRLVQETSGTSGHLLLRTLAPDGRSVKSGAEGERVAGYLGAAVKSIFREIPCDIIFSTGGNTAMAVAKAMGIKAVTLREELMPGVVLGSCDIPGIGPRWFITKAGGFGGKTLLLDLAERFSRHGNTKEA